MNFRQVFRREKPYVFISRLSRGCHRSLGCVAPLVSQLLLFKQERAICFDAPSARFAFPLALSIIMTGWHLFHFHIVFEHPASKTTSARCTSKTNGFEIGPNGCQRTTEWPHHRRFASVQMHIWRKKQLFCYRRDILQWSNVMLFFSSVWKAFCLWACD